MPDNGGSYLFQHGLQIRANAGDYSEPRCKREPENYEKEPANPTFSIFFVVSK